MSYEATILIAGKKYTGKGATPIDALRAILPVRAKGSAILIFSNGKSTKEKVLMPLVMHRLFNSSKLARELALKNLSTLFTTNT